MQLILRFLCLLLVLFADKGVSQTFTQLVDSAEKMFLEKKYQEAARIYESAVAKSGEDSLKTLINVADCCYKAADTSNMFRIFKRMVNSGWHDKHRFRLDKKFRILDTHPEVPALVRKMKANYNNYAPVYYFGLYYGVLLILCVLNLFLYFRLRERSYLFYSLLVFTDAILELTIDLNDMYVFYIMDIIGWLFQPAIIPYLFKATIPALILFYILFSQAFLQTKKHLPVHHRVLNILSFCMVLFALLRAFKLVTPVVFNIFQLLMFGTFIYTFVLALMTWRRGMKEARLYLLASVSLTTFMLLGVAEQAGAQVSLSKIGYYPFLNFSLLVFYVILSFALGDRMKLMRLEKEQAQEKALLVLEERVRDRTAEVVKQKHLVEEKQKEILDSIRYAKRLQEAILPPKKFIGEVLPESFVLYQPKDVVAGDFYWAEKRNGIFLIAAADSTGHGVPGAMVSVVCSNALNRSVKEFDLTEPGRILDKTRELVIETFEKSVSEVKDGMDVSLLSIDRPAKKIRWSGANNPLWYIQDNQLQEIRPDKQPVGVTQNARPFQTHEIEWGKGITFYLFTDGFADQFGGPQGKKFKYKQFEEFLLAIHGETMERQKELIAARFQEWKGDLEQVDDVCVIGLRVDL